MVMSGRCLHFMWLFGSVNLLLIMIMVMVKVNHGSFENDDITCSLRFILFFMYIIDDSDQDDIVLLLVTI